MMNSVYTHYPEAKVQEEYFNVDFLDFLDEIEPKRHDNGTSGE